VNRTSGFAQINLYIISTAEYFVMTEMSQNIIKRVENMRVMRVCFGNVAATGLQDYPRLLRNSVVVMQ